MKLRTLWTARGAGAVGGVFPDGRLRVAKAPQSTLRMSDIRLLVEHGEYLPDDAIVESSRNSITVVPPEVTK